MRFDGMTFRRSNTIEFYEDPSSPFVRFRYRHLHRDISLVGHSRTDMAYTADGRVLLALDGAVWTTSAPRRRNR